VQQLRTVLDATLAQRASQTMTRELQRERVRILIVDDQDANGRLLERMLRGGG